MTYDRSVQNQTVKQSVTLKKYYKYLINKMLMLNIVQKKSKKESQVHIADASKPTQIMRNISTLTSPQPGQEAGMTNNHFSGFPQRSWGKVSKTETLDLCQKTP